MPFHRRAGLPAALALVALLLATAAAPAGPAAVSGRRPAAPTFIVNSFDDAPAAAPLNNGVCETLPGNQQCTLRAAIMKANHNPGGGVTIVLPAGTYTLTIASSGLDDETTGDLNITSTVTLTGAGAATTIIDANQLDRVIRVDGGALSLANVTLQNGRVSGGGGGLENFGAVTLNNVVIHDNQDHGNGGGVYNALGASLTLNNSVISGNRAGNDGGGVTSNGSANITASLISGNQASGRGGGFANFNGGVLTMTNSTVSNNSAVYGGGGFYNNDALSVITTYFSTVAGNLADSGATAAGPGGGIDNLGTVNLRTTLLGQNYAGATPSDGYGTFNSLDYNLIQTLTNMTLNGVTTHNVPGGQDPRLDVAHDNGGPTPTRALLPGSPALDAVPVTPTNECLDPLSAPLTVDQRGFPRPLNGACDIGAYEGHLPGPNYFRNLVRNGDAEAAAGSPSSPDPAFVAVPDWTNSGQLLTVVPYNTPGGFPSVPTDTVPANHGDNFFAGGLSGAAGGHQTIDLSPFAGFIDTGGVSYDFSAELGGYLDQGDNVQIEADFYDQGNALRTQAILGPVSTADRGNLTALLHRETSALVPAGTRSVTLYVTMTQVNGPYNDGYADNISLLLLPPDALYLPLVER
jgi:CSLREA domain-containing protein